MTELDRRMDQAILSVLSERDPHKTIRPSEAARAVSADAGEGYANRPRLRLRSEAQKEQDEAVLLGRDQRT